MRALPAGPQHGQSLSSSAHPKGRCCSSRQGRPSRSSRPVSPPGDGRAAQSGSYAPAASGPVSPGEFRSRAETLFSVGESHLSPGMGQLLR